MRAQTSPQNNYQLCWKSFLLGLISSGEWSNSCLKQKCPSCLLRIFTKCGKKACCGSSAVAYLRRETPKLRPVLEIFFLCLWATCELTAYSPFSHSFLHSLTHKCQHFLQSPELLISQLRNIPPANPGQHYPGLGFHLCGLLQGCMGEHYVSTWFTEEIHRTAQIKQNSLSEVCAILSSRSKFTASWKWLESADMSLMNEPLPLPRMQLIPLSRHFSPVSRAVCSVAPFL